MKPSEPLGPMPMVANRETVDSYFWHDGACQAWRLMEQQDLTVIEEVMPPGTAEQRHSHTFARQFFYVLEGRAVMEAADRVLELGPGDGVQVVPKQAHRIRNDGDTDLRVLVISAPRATGDRTPR